MYQPQPLPEDHPFTLDELYGILDIFETAVQAVETMRASGPSGTPPVGKARLLAVLRWIADKAGLLGEQTPPHGARMHHWHVYPLDQAGEETASVSEFIAATAAGALAQTAEMSLARCADVAGWKVLRAGPAGCTQLGAGKDTEPRA